MRTTDTYNTHPIDIKWRSCESSEHPLNFIQEHTVRRTIYVDKRLAIRLYSSTHSTPDAFNQP